jgi:hypothetical protein
MATMPPFVVVSQPLSPSVNAMLVTAVFAGSSKVGSPAAAATSEVAVSTLVKATAAPLPAAMLAVVITTPPVPPATAAVVPGATEHASSVLVVRWLLMAGRASVQVVPPLVVAKIWPFIPVAMPLLASPNDTQNKST